MTKSAKGVNWGLVGNVVNAAMLASILAYGVAVVGHSRGAWALNAFGTQWAADGFCLSFKPTLYHTHLLCLYADTVLAGVLWALSRRCAGRPELSVVKENVASVLLHGLTHGALWLDYSSGGTLSGTALVGTNDAALHSAASFPGLPLLSALAAGARHLSLVPFWLSFTYLMTPSPLWLAALQSAFHSLAMANVIPSLLAFTYVNTVITLNIAGAQLLTAPRDVYYALFAILYGGPVLAATFAEPLLCDSFLVHWGGHLLFDLSIPFGAILYYVVASRLPPRVRHPEVSAPPPRGRPSMRGVKEA